MSIDILPHLVLVYGIPHQLHLQILIVQQRPVQQLLTHIQSLERLCQCQVDAVVLSK